MKSLSVVTCGVLCLSLVPFAAAQTASQKLNKRPTSTAAATPASTVMTNDDVISLASVGMSDDVVIAKIHAAPSTNFDTSVAGLKALKAAGVSNGVIRYMVDPSAPATAPATAAAAAAPANNPDDPMSAHSPGVYMLAPGKDGATHLVKLDHINAGQHKVSGAWLSGMTYGIAKGHSKAAIDGAHATVQTPDTNPVFYAYIPQDNTSFGGNAITVRDLTLIKFDTKDKTREINTGSFSPWGSSMGTDDKAKQGFTYEQVKPEVYKMTLDRPLPPGQYAFQHMNFGAFFDFGVIPPQ